MRALGLVLGLSVWCTSCALEPASSEDLAEAAQVSEPVVGGWALGPLKGHATLALVSTHVCLLTKVDNAFTDESSVVGLSQSNDSWKLVYFGGSAESYCFPLSGFKVSRGAAAVAPRVFVETKFAGYPAVVSTAPGSAFPFLTGVFGALNSAHARVETQASFFPATASTFTAIAGPTKVALSGSALTFGTGAGAQRVARYLKADGTRTDVSNFAEYAIAAGQSSVTMAPTKDAACGLTGLRGSATGNIVAEIVARKIDGVEHWVLTSRSPAYAKVGARCIARDQSF